MLPFPTATALGKAGCVAWAFRAVWEAPLGRESSIRPLLPHGELGGKLYERYWCLLLCDFIGKGNFIAVVWLGREEERGVGACIKIKVRS